MFTRVAIATRVVATATRVVAIATRVVAISTAVWTTDSENFKITSLND